MLKEILYDFCGYNVSIFYYLNFLGNIGVIPYILSILSEFFRIWSFAIYYMIICCYQYYVINGVDNMMRREQLYYDRFHKIVLAGICYASFGFIYAMLKFSINLPRPYCSLPEDTFFTIANMDGVRCLSSFPSAHTGLALLITICLWRYLSNLYRAIALFVVVLVAWSRIVMAMHYPADILYSIAITIISVILSRFVYNLLSQNVIKYCADHAKILFIKKRI